MIMLLIIKKNNPKKFTENSVPNWNVFSEKEKNRNAARKALRREACVWSDFAPRLHGQCFSASKLICQPNSCSFYCCWCCIFHCWMCCGCVRFEYVSLTRQDTSLVKRSRSARPNQTRRASVHNHVQCSHTKLQHRQHPIRKSETKDDGYTNHGKRKCKILIRIRCGACYFMCNVHLNHETLIHINYLWNRSVQ